MDQNQLAALQGLQQIANPNGQLSNVERLQQQLAQRQQESSDRRREQIGTTQQKINELSSQSNNGDRFGTALAGLADLVSGSRGFSQLHNSTKGPDKDDQLAQLRGSLQRQQEGLDRSETANIEQQLEQARGAQKFDFQRQLLSQRQQGDINLQKLRNESKREGKKVESGKKKTFKETERKDAIFFRRVEQAERDLEDLVNEGYDRTKEEEGLKTYLPGYSKSGNLKRQEQAELNFLTAVLRKESGALIGPDELKKGELQYFTRARDTPEVVAQKRRNRLVVMEGLKAGSNGAWKDIDISKIEGSRKSNKKSVNKSSAEKELEGLLGL